MYLMRIRIIRDEMILKGEYIHMKYSDNITIQKFIEQLVDVLKYENEYREPNSEKLNIPFLIAALWQDLVDNYTLYDDFCSDLRDCDSYDIVI